MVSIFYAILVLTLFILISCGGGGDGTSSATCPNIPNGDFESGKTNWTEYSPNGWDLILEDWEQSTIMLHSGTWAVWLGGDDNEINYVEQQVNVSSTCPYLVFYHYIVSADNCGYDYGYTRINGITVDTVNLCEENNTGGWVAKSINLSDYAGKTVTLQIRAETNGSLNSNWYVDDVSFQSSNAESKLTTGAEFQRLPITKKDEASTKSSVLKAKLKQ